MRPCLILAAALTVSVPLSAQFTSPAGYLTKEGATNHDYMMFSKAEMRWQAIDRSSIGKPSVINSVAWRRDGGASTNTSYAARTLTNFEFVLADADYMKTQEDDLSLNYKGTPAIVIGKKTVNAIDWTQKPVTSPAPFTNALKFDRPYVYRGVDSLLWEVRYSANTAAGKDYAFDFQYVGSSSANSTTGTIVGTACKSTGMSSAISLYVTFYNHGDKFRIYRSVYRMPASAAVFLNLDAKNQNLNVPGLCTSLYALPLILLPLGQASSSGLISGSYIDNIPHVKGLAGADLWFQAWAVDLGQPSIPLSLSYARKITVPADPVPTAVTRYYHYKTTPTSSLTKSGPWYGGIITRFSP